MMSFVKSLAVAAVLPLTREWIEMASKRSLSCSDGVLPLTREWIEIPNSFKIRFKRI